ncbi:DUF1328 family protein [Pseudorhodoplanes sinuspersici]|uniref:UPF0391 membrane protein CAK95_00670 n=1 Tax=Pseudorhodoplanes sinuspersici TaxID=1235591 RepID=A0A1W6ZLV0_9HYPH|nr:DUF1328 family protein [Pseudorhodoplanes sinuspersici]ARP97754.1 DUF1328 domain-containing protein [Pseudorhodoplanes sinuspersici]RKE68521.1 uncharacterized protein DUF1328 [Pseudorhodoplanes sinuspersici]
MLKWAILFLILSIVAGAIGFTNISVIAKRIAMVLFALLFLGFLALLAFAWIIGEAISTNRVMLFFPSFV